MSRLSRDDWAVAALEALAVDGVSAVAVEPLAIRLGATKGSFYWHFKARSELLEAALELWETTHTLEVIEHLEGMQLPPDQRLRHLFLRAFDLQPAAGADLALLGHTDDPIVRAAVQRVTERRVAYVAALLRECGVPAVSARRRAVFAYSSFLGHLQLLHTSADFVAKSVGSMRRYADDVVADLIGPVEPSP